MKLAQVTRFRVPAPIAARTEDALKRAGSDGFEMMILWSGVYADSELLVRTPYAPRQTSYQLDDGLCVRIEGQELHRLNLWLHDSGEVLCSQIHTHPTEAYHSDTDDSFPVATELGALSIVVPNFATRGLLTAETAVYRLFHEGWRRLSLAEVDDLVWVVP